MKGQGRGARFRTFLRWLLRPVGGWDRPHSPEADEYRNKAWWWPF
ncbi:hypothetical protein ACIA8O_35290 [Kitasatospora sp. NPDC051853]